MKKMFDTLAAKFVALFVALCFATAMAETVALPQANVDKKTAAELDQLMDGASEMIASIPVYGWTGSEEPFNLNLNQVGTTSASEAFIFTAKQESTGQEVLNEYGGWNCDYVVSFDSGVDANSVILAGYYGNMLMSFLVPQNFRGNNADEMFLLNSVGFGMSYSAILGNVGTFVCTAVNVSKENIGKKITVSLVMWPSNGDRVADRRVVTSIEYEFTASNLSTLDVEVPGLGKVPFVYVSTGLDSTYGMAFDGSASLVKQTVAGPHFSPNYVMDVKAPDATGAVTVEIDVTSGAGGSPSPVGAVKVSTDGTTTIDKFSVEKVVGEAVAALTLGNMETTIVIGIAKQSVTSSASSIEYDVKPIATVNGAGTPLTLSNADLAANASFTFDLDVTALGVQVGGSVKVKHVSKDPAYADETMYLQAVAGENEKVVVMVTTSHFSTFTLSPLTSQPVSTSVQSANLFGAVKITGNVASNMYVAVPFEGFESAGAARKAKDVVHPANLTAETKMYVYDKANDSHDVYKVASGAWAPAVKVTIDSNNAATLDAASLDRAVPAGTGVLVARANTGDNVYVYGQIPGAAVNPEPFAIGQTFVAPPYTNATVDVSGVKYIDLNASKWTGVSAARQNRKLVSGADFIQFRDANNRLIKFYYDGTSWGLQPTYAKLAAYKPYVEGDRALVPQGTAFWYCSSVGGAKVEWTK